MLLGGYSEFAKPEKDILDLVTSDEIKHAVGEKLQKNIESLDVKEVAHQVVAGMNYKVHATINNSEDVTYVVYKNLPHYKEKPSVTQAHSGFD